MATETMFTGDYNNDWNKLMQNQQREQENAQDAGIESLGKQTMADFDDLVARDNAAQTEATNRRNATLGALMIQARNNRGFIPKAILGEASQRMGIPIAGGNYDKNGNFMLYSMSQGQDGQAQFTPLAVASPAQQLLVLQRAKMGPDMRREIYGVLRGRNSADTLAKYGIEDPDAPSPTGPAVTMGGGTAQRLGAPILGPEKRGGSMFYTNGKGYTLRSYSGPETGFQPVMESNDAGAQWKVLSVGPDPNDPSGQRQVRRYENSETGEVISVPDGSSIESVVRGTSEKERIAAMNNASREAIQRDKSDTRRDLAEAANVLKKYGIDVSAMLKERGLDIAEANGAAKDDTRQWNKDIDASIKQDQMELLDGRKYEELSEAEKKKYDALQAERDRRRGFGSGEADGNNSGQSEDRPVAPPDGKDVFEHNGKTYRWGWVPEQKRWAYVPQQAQASASQQNANTGDTGNAGADTGSLDGKNKTADDSSDASSRFVAAGGEYSEDEDTGLRKIRIRNFDYLPEAVKKQVRQYMKETDDSYLDMEKVAQLQEEANIGKKKIDDKWKAEAARLEADWKKRGWTPTRINRQLANAERAWRMKNDPQMIRERKDAELRDTNQITIPF